MAPFFPYITEEIWSLRFSGVGRDSSVHTTGWPNTSEISAVKPVNGDPYDFASRILNRIRAAKSSSKKSLKWPVEKVKVTVPTEQRHLLSTIKGDISSSGKVREIVWNISSDTFTVQVELAENNLTLDISPASEA